MERNNLKVIFLKQYSSHSFFFYVLFVVFCPVLITFFHTTSKACSKSLIVVSPFFSFFCEKSQNFRCLCFTAFPFFCLLSKTWIMMDLWLQWVFSTYWIESFIFPCSRHHLSAGHDTILNSRYAHRFLNQKTVLYVWPMCCSVVKKKLYIF